MPDLLATFQSSAREAALAVLSSAPSVATTLQESYAKAAAAATTTTQQEGGGNVQNVVSTTLANSDTVLHGLATLEQYISLTVPKMEDGGNFGVGIQLEALKLIQDTSTKILKSMEELSKYPSARADAMDKCGTVPTVVTTETKTTGGTDDPKTITEVKATSSTGPASTWRSQAVSSVDDMYQRLAHALHLTAMTGFLRCVDFCDKNSTKLDKPKGDSGSRGYGSSMY